MARDKIHEAVKKALQNDGWAIISDPFRLPVEGANLEIDMEAEKVLAAVQENDKILIEVKSFRRTSLLYSFYEAYGQYSLYRSAVEESNLDYEIYLAISTIAYFRIKNNPFLWRQIEKNKIKLLVIDISKQKIVSWKK